MNEVKVGTVFNKIGHWFSVVDEIISTSSAGVLMAKCHEDDGFEKFVIFENDNEEWHATGSTTDENFAVENFNMTVNYRKSIAQ